MGRLFGTDGVRGIANTELTCELMFKMGKAGAYVLTSTTHRPSILVARDTRLSGDMLEAALVAGICSVGARPILLGVLPTPAIAYLTRYYSADAGVMISASHNPMEHNGIKWFDGLGYKLPDELEDRIEALIDGGIADLPSPTGAELGRAVHQRNARRDYLDFLESTTTSRFDKLNVVLDCANGAASEVAPEIFKRLGAEVRSFYDEPDGVNINAKCGSTHPGRLRELVSELGADIGLAFDGDADRLIAVDERGNLVDGDKVMAICANNMRAEGKLNHDTVVYTIMSNMGLDIALREKGIKAEKTNVGDRYVIECMREGGYNLGGEQSGHLIFSDFNTTGDGILSAIQLMTVMDKNKKSLSRLASIMKQLPQVLVGAKVSNENKLAYKDDELITAEIAKIEKKFDGKGRVLIRPSGTEPLVRVMIEGENQAEIEKDAVMLRDLIQNRHGGA